MEVCSEGVLGRLGASGEPARVTDAEAPGSASADPASGTGADAVPNPLEAVAALPGGYRAKNGGYLTQSDCKGSSLSHYNVNRERANKKKKRKKV